MKRDECWMNFTEALELYLQSREVMRQRPPGSEAYRNAESDLQAAKDHMDALAPRAHHEGSKT
jgi:hypothetical protein